MFTQNAAEQKRVSRIIVTLSYCNAIPHMMRCENICDKKSVAKISETKKNKHTKIENMRQILRHKITDLEKEISLN